MTLYSYLKQFKNIAWYPSAGRDFRAIVNLNNNSFFMMNLPKEDVPDCFIYTDYCSYSDDEEFFLEKLAEDIDDSFLQHNGIQIFNLKELDRLDLPFDQNIVVFDKDNNYGRVFVMDIYVDSPKTGKSIAKLIYVVIENTSFAFNYLLPKKIKIKYPIYAGYGYGFGGGNSTGAYMCQILKDLKAEYYISDIRNPNMEDVADVYLSDEQKSTLPIIEEYMNLDDMYKWFAFDDVILYKIKGYETQDINSPLTRYILK